MNTSNSSVAAVISTFTSAPKYELSQDDADTLEAGLSTLHGVVRNVGEGLPSYEKCSLKDLETIAVRAVLLLREKAARAKEEKVRAIRAAVQGVFEAYMVQARKEKAEFDALSDSLKKRLGGTFPDTVQIPVSQLVACFDASLTTEQIIHNLSNLMSYKIGKGKERGSEAYVILPFKA